MDVMFSDIGRLFLGMNQLIQKPINGKIADVRLYHKALTPLQVAALHNFNFNDTYVEMIVETDDNDPRAEHEYKPEFDLVTINELLSPIQRDLWMQITASLNAKETQIVCSKFGGELLDVDEVPLSTIRDYVVFIVEQPLANYWVQSNNESCMSVSVTPGKTVLSKTQCSLELRSLCSVHKDAKFVFIGESKRVNYELIGSDYVWDSTESSQLNYIENEKKFFNLHPVSKTLYAVAEASSLSEVIGRREWSNVKGTWQRMYTFSSCNEEQFTCSNGDCVNLRGICNFVEDCSDASDEKLCNHTQSRPSYYERDLSGQSKLLVKLTATLERVVDIDMAAGTITIELHAVVNWKDYRVVFQNLHAGKKTLLDREDAKYYWHPNLLLKGVANSDTYALSMDRAPQDVFIEAQTIGKKSVFESQEGE